MFVPLEKVASREIGLKVRNKKRGKIIIIYDYDYVMCSNRTKC